MKNLPILMHCSIALIVLFTTLDGTIDASPLSVETHENNGRQLKQPLKFSARQSDVEDSYEDSDEDDGEDDAEQAQQNLIEQQNQQENEESQEGSDEEEGEDDGGDDNRRRRRRRAIAEDNVEVDLKQEMLESTTMPPDGTVDEPITTIIPETFTTKAPRNRTAVLMIIRDAIRKVATAEPTKKVATSALQYFLIFQYFIQQTINQVLGGNDYDYYDDYEDEIHATTIANEINEAIPTEQPEPAPETASAIQPDVAAAPAPAAAAAAAEIMPPEHVAHTENAEKMESIVNAVETNSTDTMTAMESNKMDPAPVSNATTAAENKDRSPAIAA